MNLSCDWELFAYVRVFLFVLQFILLGRDWGQANLHFWTTLIVVKRVNAMCSGIVEMNRPIQGRSSTITSCLPGLFYVRQGTYSFVFPTVSLLSSNQLLLLYFVFALNMVVWNKNHLHKAGVALTNEARSLVEAMKRQLLQAYISAYSKHFYWPGVYVPYVWHQNLQIHLSQ